MKRESGGFDVYAGNVHGIAPTNANIRMDPNERPEHLAGAEALFGLAATASDYDGHTIVYHEEFGLPRKIKSEGDVEVDGDETWIEVRDVEVVESERWLSIRTARSPISALNGSPPLFLKLGVLVSSELDGGGGRESNPPAMVHTAHPL